jgi:DNA-binding MarR family transcriptional regulator
MSRTFDNFVVRFRVLVYSLDMARSGAGLAHLLLGGFRSLVDAAIEELANRGYKDVRPVHEFAMRAIAAGANNASELGRRLSVSKQAAAKTITVLQERGYVARDADPVDARRKRLQVTALGFEVLRIGEAIFDELRGRWEKQIGTAQLENIEKHLTTLIGTLPESFDTPGWMAQDPGEIE